MKFKLLILRKHRRENGKISGMPDFFEVSDLVEEGFWEV